MKILSDEDSFLRQDEYLNFYKKVQDLSRLINDKTEEIAKLKSNISFCDESIIEYNIKKSEVERQIADFEPKINGMLCDMEQSLLDLSKDISNHKIHYSLKTPYPEFIKIKNGGASGRKLSIEEIKNIDKEAEKSVPAEWKELIKEKGNYELDQARPITKNIHTGIIKINLSECLQRFKKYGYNQFYIVLDLANNIVKERSQHEWKLRYIKDLYDDCDELLMTYYKFRYFRNELFRLCDECRAKANETYDGYIKSKLDWKKSYESELKNKNIEAFKKSEIKKLMTEISKTFTKDWVESCYIDKKEMENELLSVNLGRELRFGTLFFCYVNIPFDKDYLLGRDPYNKVREALLKKGFDRLINRSDLQLPLGFRLNSKYTWLIENTATCHPEDIVPSLMFQALSNAPVGKLVFDIIDPVNKGQILEKLCFLREKLPQVFDGGICDNASLVKERLNSLMSIIKEREAILDGKNYEEYYASGDDRYEGLLPIHLVVFPDYNKTIGDSLHKILPDILARGKKAGVYFLFTSNEKVNVSDIEFDYFINNDVDKISCLPFPDENSVKKFVDTYYTYSLILGNNDTNDHIIKSMRIARKQPKKALDEVKNNKIHLRQLEEGFLDELTIGLIKTDKNVLGYKKADECEIPLKLFLRDKADIFIHTENSGVSAKAFMNGIIWGFISHIPATKFLLDVFDKDERGQGIKPLLNFINKTNKEKCPVMENTVCTMTDTMLKILKNLNKEIDSRSMEKMAGKFENILDYNEKSGKNPEILHLLVINDFPNGLNRECLSELLNIIKNGNPYGIYTVLVGTDKVNENSYDNSNEFVAEIVSACMLVEEDAASLKAMPTGIEVLPLPLPDENGFSAFADEYVNKVKAKESQVLDFEELIKREDKEELFNYDSSYGIEIPFGFDKNNEVLSLKIGEGLSHHGIIAGVSGSGKTSLLHAIILSSMLHYGPDELQLYLMDFKSGTEFKVYDKDNDRPLPNIRLLAIETKQEFGESILEELEQEIEERSRLFKEAGSSNISEYRKNTGKKMPRILVLIDEFQVLYNDAINRKVANHCAEMTKYIVSQGRSFGIHLIMSTQTMKNAMSLALPAGTIEDMRIRIGMHCNENETLYLFSDTNAQDAYHMMNGPVGTGVLNQDYSGENNIGFRAAWCSPETKEKYLKLIREKHKDLGEEYFKGYRVFEGGRQENFIDFVQKNKEIFEANFPSIAIGSKVKVAPPLVLELNRRKSHNTIILGSDEAMLKTISEDFIISALLNKNTNVYVVDGLSLVYEEENDKFNEMLSASSDRFHLIEADGGIVLMLREIYEVYRAAKREKNKKNTVIFFRDLQYIDIITSLIKGDSIDESDYLDEDDQDAEGDGDRESESIPEKEKDEARDPFAEIINADFSGHAGNHTSPNDEKKKPLQKILLEMLKDGSRHGIYFAVSSNEYNTIKDSMYSVSTKPLQYFNERLIFGISEDAASTLLNGTGTIDMGEKDYAYYYNTNEGKEACQIMPFKEPSVEELKNIL